MFYDKQRARHQWISLISDNMNKIKELLGSDRKMSARMSVETFSHKIDFASNWHENSSNTENLSLDGSKTFFKGTKFLVTHTVGTLSLTPICHSRTFPRLKFSLNGHCFDKLENMPKNVTDVLVRHSSWRIPSVYNFLVSGIFIQDKVILKNIQYL